jgi:casein kinase II subunit beta
MYCPKCTEVYLSEDPLFSDIDGAFFGSAWVHLFLSMFPDVRRMKQSKDSGPLRLFGFRIELDDEEDDTDDYQSSK